MFIAAEVVEHANHRPEKEEKKQVFPPVHPMSTLDQIQAREERSNE